MTLSAISAAVLSIWAIAAAAWAARRLLRLPVCPICVGVAGTWLWMLIARLAGYAFDASMLPILLGGSVVGVAYQLEQRLPAGRPAMAWKVGAIPPGFVAAHALAEANWSLLALSLVALAVLAAIFFFLRRPNSGPRQDSDAVERLKAEMKNCC